MTVSEVRILIHEARTAVEVDVLIDHALEILAVSDKQFLLEILVEDSVSVPAKSPNELSRKLKNINLAIVLLQSGFRI